MNKSHLTAKAGIRARPSIPAARVRHSLLERDDLADVGEDPWLPQVADDEYSDWSGAETGAGHAGSRYGGQVDDFLAPDVETQINLLLHGASYR